MRISFPDSWGPDEVAAFIANADKPLPEIKTPLFDLIERKPAIGTVHHYTETTRNDQSLEPDPA